MNNSEQKKDLKEDLKKKERAFRALKAHEKIKLDKTKELISKEKDEKHREIDEKEEKIHEKFEKEHEQIDKEAKKEEKQAEMLSEKEIAKARRELISIEKRVYSRRRKIINGLQFAGVIYLFIFAVVILKDVAIALSGSTITTLTSTINTHASAFGAGWFASIIAQSASVVAILANTLVGSGVIDFNTVFYILLGVTLGNSVTPVIASLVIKTDHHWRLRHGFELGLANVIYSTFLIIIVFLIQSFTGFFTNVGESVNTWSQSLTAFQKIPDLLSVITDPVKNLLYFDYLPTTVIFIIGVFLLIFSLGRVGKSMFVFLGGKRHARAIMEKHLGNYWKAFFVGLGLTIIIPSSSLLVTLMVPLAIARIVTLRQAIPYLIGTNVGTFIDVLFAAFANAQSYAIAGGVVLTLMSAFGVLFIFKNFGSTLIYKVTRYLSLHGIKMRKRNILKFLGGFILIPALIMVIF